MEHTPLRNRKSNKISGGQQFNQIIEKKEVRGQGKPTQAQQAIERPKFEQALSILNGFDDFNRQFFVTTEMRFQFCMVARLDDACNLKKQDLKRNLQYPSSILCQMCWSKNVLEERDAPDQLLLGAANQKYCILLALAVYLGSWLESSEARQSEFVFGSGTKPKHAKDLISGILKNSVFENPEFEMASADRKLGTHSMQKFPSTYA